MTDLLKRIRLIDDVKVELSIDRSVFVKTLDSNIDRPQSTFSDLFSRSNHIYKGTVSHDGFNLKRKRKFFDSNMNWAKSKGVFTQIEDKLIIDIQINAFHPIMIVFVIMGLIVYGGFLVSMVIGEWDALTTGLILPFMLFHALFMFGIPYLMLRRSINVMKYNIERDLFFIVKDKLNYSPAQS